MPPFDSWLSINGVCNVIGISAKLPDSYWRIVTFYTSSRCQTPDMKPVKQFSLLFPQKIREFLPTLDYMHHLLLTQNIPIPFLS